MVPIGDTRNPNVRTVQLAKPQRYLISGVVPSVTHDINVCAVVKAADSAHDRPRGWSWYGFVY